MVIENSLKNASFRTKPGIHIPEKVVTQTEWIMLKRMSWQLGLIKVKNAEEASLNV